VCGVGLEPDPAAPASRRLREDLNGIGAADAMRGAVTSWQMRLYAGAVTTYRIGEAAELLGVSVDTVRRWIDAGRLGAARDEHGHRTVAGADLAAFARSLADDPDEGTRRSSARNRLRGIVTAITRDQVMAQVDIQAGPFRVVSLMSREAVDALGLEVGSPAVAVIKSTTVVVER
jgi:molybdopterin-binding protein